MVNEVSGSRHRCHGSHRRSPVLRSRGPPGWRRMNPLHPDRPTPQAPLARIVSERIGPAIRRETIPLDVRAWEAPGEPVPVAEAATAPFEPFAIGTPWGRPWGTTWFALAGTVPDRWAGELVEARVDLGFATTPGFQSEGLVWARAPSGTWVPRRGLHPLNHSFVVADPAKGGEELSVLVEA